VFEDEINGRGSGGEVVAVDKDIDDMGWELLALSTEAKRHTNVG